MDKQKQMVVMRVGSLNSQQLYGIYSSMSLAKAAALHYMRQVGGLWKVDEREHEYQAWLKSSVTPNVIILDYWRIDTPE